MPIYTRRGDKGETDSFAGRAQKDDPRIEAIGQVDEFNALVGMSIAFSEDEAQSALLKEIQKDLFVLGAELAGAHRPLLSRRITPQRVSDIETDIDAIEAELPKLVHFVLPGGCKSACMLHFARTVCRRAERSLVTLSKKEKVDSQAITYLNRLSDLLYVMALAANRKKRVEETVWRGR